MARFWWGGDATKRKMHWCKMDKLCLPKSHEGLGFKSLGNFNQALLAKQGWRIIPSPHSLVARVLKAKYFHSGNFMTATLNSSAFFLWCSFIWGRDIIHRRHKWKVGDWRSIRVFQDCWLPSPATLRPITVSREDEKDRCVDSLISDDSGKWSRERIEEAV